MEGFKELLTGVILLFGVIASIVDTRSAKKLVAERGFLYVSHKVMIGAIGLICLAGCVYQFYKFFINF